MTTYDQLKDTLKAGDIILFKGTDTPAKEIELLEDFELLPPYTHIGIVFRFPDGKPSPDILIWQAAPVSSFNSKTPADPFTFGSGFGPDYIKGVDSDGCVLVSLDWVMNWAGDRTKNPDPFSMLVARQITPALSPEMVDNMEYAIRLLDGRSFSSPVQIGMPLDYAEGAILKKESSNATFFCSKLATFTFQMSGILDKSIVANSVLPGHYGQKSTSNKLVFIQPYTFGPEIPFSIPETGTV